MSADHPRACGENSLVSEIEHGALGSPPRMRGKLAAKDRLKAAELLGKRYGIFKENVGVTMDAVVIVDDLKE